MDELQAALLEKAKRERARRQSGVRQLSPERLQAAAEADRIAEAQIVQSGTGGKLGGFLAKGAQGLPFVGEWIDEGVDKLQPGAGERLTAMRDAYEVTNPKLAMTAEITGGIAGSIPFALKGADLALKGAGTLSRVARGAMLGATAGAAEGASQGAGRAEPGARAQGGAEGAAWGGSIGGLVGSMAPLVGAGARSVVKRVKKLDINTISDQFGISKQSAKIVRRALANDDLDAAAKAIRRTGDDAMLADAGPATRQLLDAAQQSGGEALAISRNRVSQRVTQQGQRFRKSLDSILGAPGGVKAAARDISQRTAPARKAAYDRAFAQPIDYSRAGRKVEEVLVRIPPKTLNSAIKEANEAMIAEGLTNQQILAEIADDGSVLFREMPNVQQLNQIKIELGNLAASEVDQFGRKTARGLRASKLAGELRDAVSEAVPDYRRAVKLGGDKIAEDNALDLGRSLLSKRTTFEDVVTGMRGASKEAKQAARRGLRENIDQVMENARTTLTEIENGGFDFDAGQNAAKEALDALRALTTPANFKKARAVLGPDAKRLFFELERTADAMTLRTALARNSATAVRQSIQQQVRDETAPSLARRTLGNLGNPLEAGRELSRSIAKIDPGSMSDRERQLFAEIADALTGIRGEEARQALLAVRGALRGQPIKDQQAEIIGRLVGGSVVVGGHQSASQYPLQQ